VIFSVLLILLGCAGCIVDRQTHLVLNESSETVTIVWVQDDGETVIGDIPPDRSSSMHRFASNSPSYDGCFSELLVARTASGREISRHAGSFCADDTWHISDQPPSSIAPTPAITWRPSPTPVPG
jgi:hypothetical protein